MSDFENKHYDDTNNEETPRPDSNSNENPDHPGDKKPDEKAGQDDTYHRSDEPGRGNSEYADFREVRTEYEPPKKKKSEVRRCHADCSLSDGFRSGGGRNQCIGRRMGKFSGFDDRGRRTFRHKQHFR